MRRQHFNKSSFSSLLEFINTPAAAHGLNRLQSTAIAAWAGEIALEGVGRGCNLEKRRLTDGGGGSDGNPIKSVYEIKWEPLRHKSVWFDSETGRDWLEKKLWNVLKLHLVIPHQYTNTITAYVLINRIKGIFFHLKWGRGCVNTGNGGIYYVLSGCKSFSHAGKKCNSSISTIQRYRVRF